MDIAEGISHILDGNAVVFLGAGFSIGAIDLDGQPFVAGAGFASELAKESGLPLDCPLEDAAEGFVSMFGAFRLIEKLQKRFSATEVADFHRTVAKQPWKRMYTTNYDNVFEVARRLERKACQSISLDSNIFDVPKSPMLCVHLNGFIGKVDRKTVLSDLKLTETSYVTQSIVDSPWVSSLRTDCQLASAVFFLGFSMYDLDIKRVLLEIPTLKEKCFFIIGEDPHYLTESRVNRYGIPMKISVKDFAEQIITLEKVHLPVDSIKTTTTTITEHFLSNERVRISDKDFFDLLLWGVCKNSHLLESIRSGTTYYLQRHQVEKTLSLMRNGSRVFAIHSDFGNGKSLAVEGIQIRALEEGYRVFSISEKSEFVSTELEYIVKIENPVMIVFENYSRWFSEIEWVCKNASEGTVLILTERSSHHDFVINSLELATGPLDLFEISVDYIDDHEIDWLVGAFDEYGLWGEFSVKSKDEKVKFIRDNCKRQLNSILLRLLDSPNIKSKLENLVRGVKQNTTHFQILLTIFIFTVTSRNPSLNLLSDIWGVEIINRTNFRREESIKHFINFESDEIAVRSPVLSRYMLKNFADTNSIVSVLLTISTRLSKVNTGNQYRSLMTELVKYSNVQALLPNKGLRQGAIDYYERVKNLREHKDDPLFWFQYAIACTALIEIDKSLISRASKYFETSYALAKKRNWDLFQIDTHYARFLLVEAIESLTLPDAFESFQRAHNLITRQFKSAERLNYPLRVFLHYLPFVEKFGGSMTLAQLTYVNTAVGTISDLVTKLSFERSQNEVVKKASSDANNLIDILSQRMKLKSDSDLSK